MRCGLPQFQYGAFINSFRRGAASLDMAPSAPGASHSAYWRGRHYVLRAPDELIRGVRGSLLGAPFFGFGWYPGPRGSAVWRRLKGGTAIDYAGDAKVADRAAIIDYLNTLYPRSFAAVPKE